VKYISDKKLMESSPALARAGSIQWPGDAWKCESFTDTVEKI
jgi:hypothetical protein